MQFLYTIYYIESVSVVNDVFNTINKYAKLIVEEHQWEYKERDLNDIFDKLACWIG